MKRVLTFLLCVIFIFMLIACDETTTATSQNEIEQTSVLETNKEVSSPEAKEDAKSSTTTTTKAPTTTTQAPVTQTVYTTKTGKKYHSTKNCPGLSNANAIFDSTLTAAKNQGLDPCSKCH